MGGGEQAPPDHAASGRQDGPAHRQLSEIQRARILSAMVAVACERGAANATVARIVARAGVSRRTFYELFADREVCFLAAFDEAVAQASRHVLAEYDPKLKWAGRLRTTLTSLLAFLDVWPGIGWLLIVGSYGGGPIVLERRRHVLAQINDFVDEGRAEVKNGDGPPPLTAEGVVGGALSLIHTRMVDGNAPLIELTGPLMSMTVLPYLGTAAARRELSRPVPAAPDGARPSGVDPLRDLDMRLTYRTIRVLLAISERDANGSHPSNRQVADAAGIRDQGQVSKLLSRLQQLGLIDNAAEPQVKGEPNAWTLTKRGEEVRAVVSI
jgi:AcrR family transcriptional regulator